MATAQYICRRCLLRHNLRTRRLARLPSRYLPGPLATPGRRAYSSEGLQATKPPPEPEFIDSWPGLTGYPENVWKRAQEHAYAGERQPTPKDRATQEGEDAATDGTPFEQTINAVSADVLPPNMPVLTEKDDAPLKDVKWVRQNHEMPEQDEYPNVPAIFFEGRGLSDLESAFRRSVHPDFRLRSHTRYVQRPTTRLFRRTLSVRWRTRRAAVQGEGNSKREATQAAFLALIAQLHRMSLLHLCSAVRMVGSGNSPGRYDGGDMIRIFNYAARFGLIPELQSVKLRTGRIKTVISLEEQNINASAVGTTPDQAEQLAATNFKEAVQRQRTDLNLGPLALTDMSAVNLDNASNVLDFYEATDSSGRLSYRSEITKVPEGYDVWTVKVLIDQQTTAPPATRRRKEEAELLATLFAAVYLTNRDKTLFPRYLDALTRDSPYLPKHISSAKLQITGKAAITMDSTLERLPEGGFRLTKEKGQGDQEGLSRYTQAQSRKRLTRVLSTRDYLHTTRQSRRHRCIDLKLRQEFLQNTELKETLQTQLSQLPVTQEKERIIEEASSNDSIIIIGFTASGKSTQVPQIIFDDAVRRGVGASCNIICTQPRRLPAISLANRVAAERNEPVGEVVGYRVGGDSREAQLGGSITFFTPELLILQLEYAANLVFDGISHMIIDEVHERDGPTDRLLSVIRMAIQRRRAEGKSIPKVVLMSASIQEDTFRNYFGTISSHGDIVPCPVITVPGRLFPVEEKHLDNVLQDIKHTEGGSEPHRLSERRKTQQFINSEQSLTQHESSKGASHVIDWRSRRDLYEAGETRIQSLDLAAFAIGQLARSTDSGGILVFLPGWSEILYVEEILRSHSPFGVDFSDTSSYQILLLHSSHPAGLEEALLPPSEGRRRIYLSTDIAETSITLPDIRHVIDSGKRRVPQYIQQNGVQSLDPVWIAKSNATQRAGRVGRVQSGVYHALYSKQRREGLSLTAKRSGLGPGDLESSCLRAKLHFPELSINAYFSRAFDPLPQVQVDRAIHFLKTLHFLDRDENLTPLGELAATLQVRPSVGRMIVFGIVFRALDIGLVLAVAIESNGIFTRPDNLQALVRSDSIRQHYAMGTDSDEIAQLMAYFDLQRVTKEEGEEAGRAWADANFLNFQEFLGMQLQARNLERILLSRRVIPSLHAPELNTRSSDRSVIKALIYAASYPHIGIHDRNFSYWTRQGLKAEISPRSLTMPRDYYPNVSKRNPLRDTLCTYVSIFSSRADTAARIFRTTLITPLLVALLSNKLSLQTPDDPTCRTLLVDDWLPLHMSQDTDPQVVDLLLDFRDTWDEVTGTMMSRLTSQSRDFRVLYEQADLYDGFVQVVVDLLNESAETAALGSVEKSGDGNDVRGSSGEASREQTFDSQSAKREETLAEGPTTYGIAQDGGIHEFIE